MTSRWLNGGLGFAMVVLIILTMQRRWWLGPRLGSINLVPLALDLVLPAAFFFFKRAGWAKDENPERNEFRPPSILSQEEVPVSQRGMPVWQLVVLMVGLCLVGLVGMVVWAQLTGR